MKNEMIYEVAERLGAEVQTINKNGIDKIGICVRNENVGINIYADQLDVETVDEAVDKINEIVDAHREEMKKMGNYANILRNFDDVKTMLRARLYHENVPAEVKRSAKKYGFDDLIIVPYVELENSPENGKASVKVNKKILESWGVTAKEVIDIALKNTEEYTHIESMLDALQGMMGMEAPIPDMPDEYVVSTDGNAFGAAGILSKLSYFKKKLPNGFYVLPSSLHEVLVHAATGAENELEYLTKMVQDVNKTTVEPEDRLSNKAYAFVK